VPSHGCHEDDVLEGGTESDVELTQVGIERTGGAGAIGVQIDVT
jgi:hypothetical protein